jgi:phosphoribosylamine--glycine ligase
MKKQQLLVINYLLRLKAIIFASSKAEEQLNNTTDDNFTGSGGREHAFAWKMIQSPLCDTLLLRQGCWNRSNSNKCRCQHHRF